MGLLGGSFVEINFWAMVWDITKIVIIPVTAGLAFHYLIHGKFKWLDKAMPMVSMAGIALILIVITAAGRDNLLKVGALLLVATILHNVLGYLLGYWSARLLRFHEARLPNYCAGSGDAECRSCFRFGIGDGQTGHGRSCACHLWPRYEYKRFNAG